MEEFVKVLLYRGESAPEGFELKRDEFERALDMLFNADEESELNLMINGKEMSGVTDIILAAAVDESQNEMELIDDSFGLAA